MDSSNENSDRSLNFLHATTPDDLPTLALLMKAIADAGGRIRLPFLELLRLHSGYWIEIEQDAGGLTLTLREKTR